MGKTSESIEALVQFLDFSSTDAEAWMELADLYLSQGLYAQAIYAQEEALIIAPNAWNVSFTCWQEVCYLKEPLLIPIFLL